MSTRVSAGKRREREGRGEHDVQAGTWRRFCCSLGATARGANILVERGGAHAKELEAAGGEPHVWFVTSAASAEATAGVFKVNGKRCLARRGPQKLRTGTQSRGAAPALPGEIKAPNTPLQTQSQKEPFQPQENCAHVQL